MSESKIQVKVGIVEFSGEGNQDWLAKQLDKILEKVPELLKIEMTTPSNSNNGSNIHGNSHKGEATGVTGLSVINIAGKLSCKSGSDLVIAAAAFLHFVENKNTFSRDDISRTMKEAKGFYKNSFLANLTSILTQLEKNSTLNKSSNSYSLQANKVSEINAILTK